MAKQIVSGARHGTSTRADASGLELVQKTQSLYIDTYVGTAQALIRAGLITAHQVPGQSGLPKGMATFYRGVPVKRGTNTVRDEHYLQVRRIGRRFSVRVGISAQEEQRRLAAREAQQERERQEERRQREAERDARRAAFLRNPEELRGHAQGCLQMLARAIADHTPGDHQRSDPQFFSQFSGDGLQDALDALRDVADWIREAEITGFDPTDLKVSAARADGAFQAFLQSQCLGS